MGWFKAFQYTFRGTVSLGPAAFPNSATVMKCGPGDAVHGCRKPFVLAHDYWRSDQGSEDRRFCSTLPYIIVCSANLYKTSYNFNNNSIEIIWSWVLWHTKLSVIMCCHQSESALNKLHCSRFTSRKVVILSACSSVWIFTSRKVVISSACYFVCIFTSRNVLILSACYFVCIFTSRNIYKHY